MDIWENFIEPIFAKIAIQQVGKPLTDSYRTAVFFYPNGSIPSSYQYLTDDVFSNGGYLHINVKYRDSIVQCGEELGYTITRFGDDIYICLDRNDFVIRFLLN